MTGSAAPSVAIARGAEREQREADAANADIVGADDGLLYEFRTALWVRLAGAILAGPPSFA